MARSKRSKGFKDKKYLEWIRSLCCIVCSPYWNENNSPTEAAHVGDRGLSQKCSDREAIPLCRYHHRVGPQAQHTLGKRFWEHHGIDKTQLIAELNQRYESEKA